MKLVFFFISCLVIISPTFADRSFEGAVRDLEAEISVTQIILSTLKEKIDLSKNPGLESLKQYEEIGRRILQGREWVIYHTQNADQMNRRLNSFVHAVPGYLKDWSRYASFLSTSYTHLYLKAPEEMRLKWLLHELGTSLNHAQSGDWHSREVLTPLSSLYVGMKNLFLRLNQLLLKNYANQFPRNFNPRQTTGCRNLLVVRKDRKILMIKK